MCTADIRHIRMRVARSDSIVGNNKHGKVSMVNDKDSFGICIGGGIIEEGPGQADILDMTVGDELENMKFETRPL